MAPVVTHTSKGHGMVGVVRVASRRHRQLKQDTLDSYLSPHWGVCLSHCYPSGRLVLFQYVVHTSVFIFGLPLPLLFGVMGLMLGWHPPSIIPHRRSSISSCSFPLCFLCPPCA